MKQTPLSPALRLHPFFKTLLTLLFLLPGIFLHARQLELLDSIPVPGTFTTDVWGYVDPQTNIEYAIVGDQSGSGITIFDLSIPNDLQQVANVSTVPGFDLKIYQQYVYTVNSGNSGSGGIIDISDPLSPQVVGSFPSSHNIWISENGYLYTTAQGFRIYDLNNDPTQPELVWNNNSFNSHDIAIIDDRLYDFHGSGGTLIYDISQPAAPELLSVIQDPAIVYHHSGWVSEDRNYLFICDELSSAPRADITVWNISNLENPQKVGEFGDDTATVHNVMVRDAFAYFSYYSAGLRIFDISDPANLTVAAEYDTEPASSSEGFTGAFGIYTALPSGLILISDWHNGLFVFSFTDSSTGVEPAPEIPVESFALLPNYPNPFNPNTTIPFEIPENSFVNITIYNILGQPIRELTNRFYAAGRHSLEWDGASSAELQMGSGVYFYRMTVDGFSKTLKMFKVN